jgi:hypothetical protein
VGLQQLELHAYKEWRVPSEGVFRRTSSAGHSSVRRNAPYRGRTSQESMASSFVRRNAPSTDAGFVAPISGPPTTATNPTCGVGFAAMIAQPRMIATKPTSASPLPTQPLLTFATQWRSLRTENRRIARTQGVQPAAGRSTTDRRESPYAAPRSRWLVPFA